jgi:hypothetical protein
MLVMSESYHGVWLGLVNMLNVSNPPYAGTSDVELAYSTDLMNWSYVAHKTPLIPRGAPESYDCCSIFGAKQTPIIDRTSDTMKMYYTGGNGPFMGSRTASFSLATFQRDHWFGYAASEGVRATIVTTMVMVGSADTLRVSADARRGTVAVGVSGDPELSVANCVLLQGQLTERLVVWKVGPKVSTRPLAHLVGQNISLTFSLDDGATVFAFDV